MQRFLISSQCFQICWFYLEKNANFELKVTKNYVCYVVKKSVTWQKLEYKSGSLPTGN